MKGSVLLLILLVFVGSAVSHSYVECADWRFNDPNVPGWAEDQGTCHGYARKWPRGQYPTLPFGGFDNVWQGYKDQGRITYGTPTNPDNQPICHPDYQARTNPITNSYAPANANYGAMVQTSPGKQLCWTWSGRNHADNGETCVDTRAGVVCPAYINFATTANTDPSQAEMTTMKIKVLTFQNCTRNDPRYDNANRPCGGCFTVPQRSPGIYTVQWRWALNHNAAAGFDEIYTSCADVYVGADTVNTNPTSAQQQQTSKATSAQQTSQGRTRTTRTSAPQQTSEGVTQPSDATGSTVSGTDVDDGATSMYVVPLVLFVLCGGFILYYANRSSVEEKKNK